MAGSGRFTLKCPDCESVLVVDSSTGEVISHKPRERPRGGGKDFDALLRGLDEEKNQAEEIFQREVDAMKDRDRLLEEKFEEALKRAEESPDDERPLRPIDLD